MLRGIINGFPQPCKAMFAIPPAIYLPLIIAAILLGALLLGFFALRQRLSRSSQEQRTTLLQFAEHQQQQMSKLREFTLESQQRQQQFFADRQERSHSALRQEISDNLAHQNTQLFRALETLNTQTQATLKQMSEKVDTRLNHGMESSQQTFKDIISRLSRIDEAQKRIDQLAGDMRDLSDILNDKRSRGAFGESQLKTLIDNILPAQHVRYQYTLKNGRRPDCLILLPEPTGNLVIDAKFPLESYQRLVNAKTPEETERLRRVFQNDVRKHLNDIAEKYICPPETTNGAVMFIPAEAVFAEIHANHPDLVALSYRLNVWMTSPTTLAAILTTARAAIRDDATRKQAHILREQLYALHQDFATFQTRMEQLAKHINLAQKDVNDAHRSANQIATRFQELENVDDAPSPSRPQEE